MEEEKAVSLPIYNCRSLLGGEREEQRKNLRLFGGQNFSRTPTRVN